MDIQQPLEQLEAILIESRHVPGTKMRLVDADRCFELIDQLVLIIPEEIRKAQRVEQDHERLLAHAREDADRMREQAREEASRLTSEEAIVLLAQQHAAAIDERMQAEVERLHAESNEYALETLLRLREEIEHVKEVLDNAV